MKTQIDTLSLEEREELFRLIKADIDMLFPNLHSIKDLGKPLISYPTKTIWCREYEGDIDKNTSVKVLLYIRKIRGGISISGKEKISKIV